MFEQVQAPFPEVANVSPAVADAIGRVVEVLPSPLVTRDRFLRMQVRRRRRMAGVPARA